MKPVPSFPGYFACENGHVWRAGTPRKPQTNGRGYLRIKTSVNGALKDAYIHRMVCEAYNGLCPDGMECRHLDGNRQNNRPENLEWADKKTNESDKVIHGTLVCGVKNGTAVLTDEMVVEARARAKAGERIDKIAESYGVNRMTLGGAIAGKRWKHIPGGLGSYSTRRRFDADTIRKIRKDHIGGKLQREIACEHGVDQTAISAIIRRQTYTDISE